MTDSYYGRQIVKPHVWTAYVPLYFWLGGTAGAALLHAAFARQRKAERLALVQRRVALTGALLAPLFLTLDLGRPRRFLHMLRVFKPTSPMSVGSWVLSGFSGSLVLATLAERSNLALPARLLDGLALALAPMLSTYTAVLIADTATPVWHGAAGTLPFVFVASSVAGAGAIGSAFAPPDEFASARRMMIVGAFGLGLAGRRMERELGPLLAEPYREGRAGTLMRGARWCTGTGAWLGLLAGRGRFANRLAATLVIAGGILERFAIFAAGVQSARDPKYTVEPQRARLAQRAGTP